MKPAPINWQYLEISFLDCQSANQASQTNDVFIHPFKLEKCKLILIVSLTRINELLNTIWSWNKNIRRLHSVLEFRSWSPTSVTNSVTNFYGRQQSLPTLSMSCYIDVKLIKNGKFWFLKTRLWKIRIWRMLYLHLLRHQLIMNLFNIRLAQTRIIVSITLKDYKKLLVDISPNSCENTLQSKRVHTVVSTNKQKISSERIFILEKYCKILKYFWTEKFWSWREENQAENLLRSRF